MAKKTVTSWKSKKFYSILAPDNFDNQEIGDTIASDPGKLKGRTVYTSLGALTNDRGKNYMNLVFEVYEVKGDVAHTRFKKFFIPVGYLRSKVRKRTTKIDYLTDIVVGGEKVRVKIMVLSRHKISYVQEGDIKSRMAKSLEKHTSSKPEKLLQHALFGKLGTEIYKEIKTVCPIMRVEVYQIEVMH